MLVETVTLKIPEAIYLRLVSTAQATKQSLDDVMVHALRVGSPPAWVDAPAEIQSDLAALDKLDDDSLWEIARSQKTRAEMERYEQLLDQNQANTLTEAEKLELTSLRQDADGFVLRKAHASVRLRWRGHDLVS